MIMFVTGITMDEIRRNYMDLLDFGSYEIRVVGEMASRQTLKRREQRKRTKMNDKLGPNFTHLNTFADCKPAQPHWSSVWNDILDKVGEPKKEEGKNPMYAKSTASVSNLDVTVNSPAGPTESQIQRQYLFDQISHWNFGYSKQQELKELFNLHVNNRPKTPRDLIDAIKNDKFKLDEKRIKQAEEYVAEHAENEDGDAEDYFEEFFVGPFDGIIWDGPKADYKGYQKAWTDLTKAISDTKDIIMVSDPKDGLAAVQALKNWKPENAPVQ